MAFPDFLTTIEQLNARRRMQQPQQQPFVPATPLGRQVAVPLPVGYQPQSGMPQGELYPAGGGQQPQASPLFAGQQPQMPFEQTPQEDGGFVGSPLPPSTQLTGGSIPATPTQRDLLRRAAGRQQNAIDALNSLPIPANLMALPRAAANLFDRVETVEAGMEGRRPRTLASSFIGGSPVMQPMFGANAALPTPPVSEQMTGGSVPSQPSPSPVQAAPTNSLTPTVAAGGAMAGAANGLLATPAAASAASPTTVSTGPLTYPSPANMTGGTPTGVDVPNPSDFTPVQSGLPSFMGIPDQTLEQRLNSMANNFTNDYVGMNGQVTRTRNPELRMAANNLLAEMQAGRDRTGVEDRRLAASEASDRARIDAATRESNLRAATALLEAGQATSLEDAMGMVNTAQGAASTPLNGRQQPRWQQHRPILDEVAGITRRGPITSAPSGDIATFVRSVRDRYPGTDLSGVLDDYIAAHWPADAVRRYRGRTPSAVVDEYRRPQRQRELREAGLMVPGTVTGPGEGFGGMGGGW